MGGRALRVFSRCEGGHHRAPRHSLQPRSARRGARCAPLLRQLRRASLEGAGEHPENGGSPQPAHPLPPPAPRPHSYSGAPETPRLTPFPPPPHPPNPPPPPAPP